MANQRILRALKCLAVLLILSLSSLCFGETVVVQVLNGRDGQPVPNQPVTMHLGFTKTATEMVLHQQTGSSGEVRILLPPIKPDTIEVEINPTDGLHCSCRVLAKTETVVSEGLMVARPSRGSKSSAPMKPVPGHILFVVRPPGFVARLLFGL